MAVQDPIVEILANLFTVQRIGNTITAETQPILDRLFDAIADDLAKIDPAGPSLQKWRVMRQEQFIAKVVERLKQFIPEWEKTARSQLAAAGRQQGKFAETMLVTTLGEAGGQVASTPITQARMRAILTSEPFEGQILKEWSQGIQVDTLKRVRQQVRLGMINEESIPDLTKRIRGTWDAKQQRFLGGVLETTTRQAEAVVRTAVNHVSNRGLLETYRENSHVVDKVMFSAALDDRTTVLCASLDGTIYDVGDPGIPTPPLHFNCRSALVPIPAWERLGMTPPPEGVRFARDLRGVDLSKKVSVRRRRGQKGLGRRTEVPAGTTYERWLRGQPPEVQVKVLGAVRARLFRSRRISLKDMVASDRSLIPIAELLAS